MILQNILSAYLNYDKVDKIRILFPLSKTNRKMTKQLNSVKSSCYSDLSDQELAKSISTEYKSVYSKQSTYPPKTVNLTPYKEWRKQASNWYLSPLQELRNYVITHLSNYITAVIVHGSLADHTAVKGWSDADVVLIFKKGVITNQEHLTRLRKHIYKLRYYLYRIDPFQHHGFCILGEEQLQKYPESVLPISTFEEGAAAIYGNNKLRFNPIDVHGDMVTKFKLFVDSIRKLNERDQVPADRFLWKKLVAKVLLTPTLYLQAKGEYVYKAESFELAKEDFDQEWGVIDTASDIRSNWPDPPYPFRGILDGMLFRTLFPGFPVHYQILRDSTLFSHINHTRQFKREFLANSVDLMNEMRREVDYDD